jgi:CBS domain-containing protein
MNPPMSIPDRSAVRGLTVEQVMRPYAACIGEDLTLAQAAGMLTDCDLTAPTVCDEAGRVTGIVTDRDLARAIAEGEDPWMLEAAAMRTGTNQDPRPLHPQDALDEALAALVRYQLWHLPVTFEAQPVGTLHLLDVLACSLGTRASHSLMALAQTELQESFQPSHSD